MEKPIIDFGSDENYARVLKWATVVGIVVSISMAVVLLTDVLKG
ncbi:hypothetical protein [Paraburkholderia ribeironis]|nr:hypothetical protein [Paraburkholderia ribeironis]